MLEIKIYGALGRRRPSVLDSVLLGGSARYLGACAAEDVTLPTLEELKRVGSTGSPCPPSAYAWLAREKPGVGLHSTSGGTDLNGSFHGGNPWLPVFEAELQSAGLGLDVAVLDEAGDEEVAAGEQGELACRSAFPCAPLAFLGDDGEGSKYRAAYFDDNFGGGRAWRHGDWVEPTAHGGLIIHGRSDATLNPGGVRIGTAEIYNAIEPLLDASPDFSDALVSAQPFVARDGDTEIDDVRVVLFVQVADAAARDALTAAAAAGDADALVELCRCDDAFAKALKTTIRERGSPRHVPAIVCRVPDVPRTNNGKKVEMRCMNLRGGGPSRTGEHRERGRRRLREASRRTWRSCCRKGDGNLILCADFFARDTLFSYARSAPQPALRLRAYELVTPGAVLRVVSTTHEFPAGGSPCAKSRRQEARLSLTTTLARLHHNPGAMPLLIDESPAVRVCPIPLTARRRGCHVSEIDDFPAACRTVRTRAPNERGPVPVVRRESLDQK